MPPAAGGLGPGPPATNNDACWRAAARHSQGFKGLSPAAARGVCSLFALTFTQLSCPPDTTAALVESMNAL